MYTESEKHGLRLRQRLIDAYGSPMTEEDAQIPRVSRSSEVKRLIRRIAGGSGALKPWEVDPETYVTRISEMRSEAAQRVSTSRRRRMESLIR